MGRASKRERAEVSNSVVIQGTIFTGNSRRGSSFSSSTYRSYVDLTHVLLIVINCYYSKQKVLSCTFHESLLRYNFNIIPIRLYIRSVPVK